MEIIINFFLVHLTAHFWSAYNSLACIMEIITKLSPTKVK